MDFKMILNNILEFLKKEIYNLGGYGVRVLDLIITGVALIAIIIAIKYNEGEKAPAIENVKTEE